MLQEIEKGRNFGFQLLQKVGVIAFKTFYLSYPISGFSHIYDDWEQLVVGTQHELGKEGDFVSVFAFCFHLIGKRCAEILQSFTVFLAIEQYLVHHNKQFTCPIRIELTAEVFVGVESYVVLEYGFEEIEERTLTCIAFF